jgi:uncharacterized Zn finger protein
MKINFECDVCECDVIEEVMTDVIQYSTVSGIDKFDNFPYKTTVSIDYGKSNTEFGETLHYQCMNCGNILKNHGVTITTPEDLYGLLEANEMLKNDKGI